mmetsp:Transcript_28804/g.33463  ORF Transcript_28804/g.33463 Transcript_28804/m.33463 type:complete len:378 (+) Transcript_28804:155-1288(+)
MKNSCFAYLHLVFVILLLASPREQVKAEYAKEDSKDESRLRRVMFNPGLNKEEQSLSHHNDDDGSRTRDLLNGNITFVSATCADSSERFVINDVLANEKQSCKWVSRLKTEERCSMYKEARLFCPHTCNLCNCVDSFEKFDVDGFGPQKSCEWVARRDTKNRCSFDEVKKNCPATCKQCYPWCVDSSTRFKVPGFGPDKLCDWVARKDTDFRCTFEEVQKNCPVTCGGCNCRNNEERFFIASADWLENKWKKCEWVERKPDPSGACALPEVAANCPLTCGQCNDSPTPSPTETRYPVLRVVIPLVSTVQLETIPDDPDDPDELASLEGAFTTSLQASLPSGSKVVNLKISTSADSRIMHWEKCWCQYFLRCRSRTGT